MSRRIQFPLYLVDIPDAFSVIEQELPYLKSPSSHRQITSPLASASQRRPLLLVDRWLSHHAKHPEDFCRDFRILLRVVYRKRHSSSSPNINSPSSSSSSPFSMLPNGPSPHHSAPPFLLSHPNQLASLPPSLLTVFDLALSLLLQRLPELLPPVLDTLVLLLASRSVSYSLRLQPFAALLDRFALASAALESLSLQRLLRHISSPPLRRSPSPSPQNAAPPLLAQLRSWLFDIFRLSRHRAASLSLLLDAHPLPFAQLLVELSQQSSSYQSMHDTLLHLLDSPDSLKPGSILQSPSSHLLVRAFFTVHPKYSPLVQNLVSSLLSKWPSPLFETLCMEILDSADPAAGPCDPAWFAHHFLPVALDVLQGCDASSLSSVPPPRVGNALFLIELMFREPPLLAVGRAGAVSPSLLSFSQQLSQRHASVSSLVLSILVRHLGRIAADEGAMQSGWSLVLSLLKLSPSRGFYDSFLLPLFRELIGVVVHNGLFDDIFRFFCFEPLSDLPPHIPRNKLLSLLFLKGESSAQALQQCFLLMPVLYRPHVSPALSQLTPHLLGNPTLLHLVFRQPHFLVSLFDLLECIPDHQIPCKIDALSFIHTICQSLHQSRPDLILSLRESPKIQYHLTLLESFEKNNQHIVDLNPSLHSLIELLK